MQQVKLSAVIITLNEEKNIGRCLESLKGVADEIVVVDSFSTDKTEEICLLHGAHFVKHAFEGHIQQKNYAITKASNTYVLSLDADEALSDELKKSIIQVKNNWTNDAYAMNRLTNYCGKWIYHCGWYPDTKLRLFNREKGSWGGTNPHDKYSLHNNNSLVKRISGDILHYSYYTVEEHYKQAEYFSKIAAKAMFEKNKEASILNIIINPVARFIKSYFIKLGFLDGRYGFIISRISAWEVYNKYKLLRALRGG